METIIKNVEILSLIQIIFLYKIIYYNLKFLIQIIITIFVWSCSEPNSIDSKTYKNIKFNVDSKLLSSNSRLFGQLEISFAKNWGELDSNKLVVIGNIFSNDSLLNVFNLVYGQSDGSSLILISQCNINYKLKILNNFHHKLEKSFPKESIYFDKIRINDVKVNQFIATNNTHTSFHLFVELDYLYLIIMVLGNQ